MKYQIYILCMQSSENRWKFSKYVIFNGNFFFTMSEFCLQYNEMNVIQIAMQMRI